jgi:hypothetical protein
MKKTAQNKNSPNRRKFAQSVHPVLLAPCFFEPKFVTMRKKDFFGIAQKILEPCYRRASDKAVGCCFEVPKIF